MSVKDDMRKQIDAAVRRKNALSKDLSRDKTIAQWVCDFFSEVEKTKNIDNHGYFAQLALGNLANNLRSLDKKCHVMFKEPINSEPQVEIHWSSKYVLENNCEEVIALDSSSAFFQSAMEKQQH